MTQNPKILLLYVEVLFPGTSGSGSGLLGRVGNARLGPEVKRF